MHTYVRNVSLPLSRETPAGTRSTCVYTRAQRWIGVHPLTHARSIVVDRGWTLVANSPLPPPPSAFCSFPPFPLFLLLLAAPSTRFYLLRDIVCATRVSVSLPPTPCAPIKLSCWRVTLTSKTWITVIRRRDVGAVSEPNLSRLKRDTSGCGGLVFDAARRITRRLDRMPVEL